MLRTPFPRGRKSASLLIENIHLYGFAEESSTLHHVLVLPEGQFIIADSHQRLKADYSMNARGNYTLMPGMLDSHVHGQGGFDFAEVGDAPEKLSQITEALGANGLSYCMATLVSLDLPTLKKALIAINQYIHREETAPTRGRAKIVGVHLEGPFISKTCKGAHAENVLQDSISLEQFKAILGAAPSVKQWKITLAPDLKGALQFIRDVKKLEKEGLFIKVFIGHSNPDTKTIDSAIKAGAVGFTHLGNACQESCAREERRLQEKDVKSQLVRWVLENPKSCPPGVELIVDGVHLSQSFVSLIKSKIGDKVLLVTDALGPTGLSDGPYTLGKLPVRKEGGSFYLTDDQGQFLVKERMDLDGSTIKERVLAGSGASLAQCLKKYAQWTQEPEETRETHLRSLYKALIENPRNSSLSPDALTQLPDEMNFIILDNQNNLVLSLCNGKLRKHQGQLAVLDFMTQEDASFSLKLFTMGEPAVSIRQEMVIPRRLIPFSKL